MVSLFFSYISALIAVVNGNLSISWICSDIRHISLDVVKNFFFYSVHLYAHYIPAVRLLDIVRVNHSSQDIPVVRCKSGIIHRFCLRSRFTLFAYTISVIALNAATLFAMTIFPRKARREPMFESLRDESLIVSTYATPPFIFV